MKSTTRTTWYGGSSRSSARPTSRWPGKSLRHQRDDEHLLVVADVAVVGVPGRQADVEPRVLARPSPRAPARPASSLRCGVVSSVLSSSSRRSCSALARPARRRRPAQALAAPAAGRRRWRPPGRRCCICCCMSFTAACVSTTTSCDVVEQLLDARRPWRPGRRARASKPASWALAEPLQLGERQPLEQLAVASRSRGGRSSARRRPAAAARPRAQRQQVGQVGVAGLAQRRRRSTSSACHSAPSGRLRVGEARRSGRPAGPAPAARAPPAVSRPGLAGGAQVAQGQRRGTRAGGRAARPAASCRGRPAPARGRPGPRRGRASTLTRSHHESPARAISRARQAWSLARPGRRSRCWLWSVKRWPRKSATASPAWRAGDEADGLAAPRRPA